jgi:L-alanine-DL-glutamate epimerase-like enolase superfamily enzyme
MQRSFKMANSSRIQEVKAYPSSHRVSPEESVTLGIGRMVKRDAVIVKVITADGIVGYGESHHGRCPGAVAQLVNTTLSQLVVGKDAFDVIGVWDRIYRMQLASHGMGAAAGIAMSGIDMALWDIRGKAAGWPLYRLLGGVSQPIPAYAGGVSLGYQELHLLVEEVRALVEAGYKAIKHPVIEGPSYV